MLFISSISCSFFLSGIEKLLEVEPILPWQVHNPATGDVVASVPCMGKQETTDAISSAYDAFNCMKLHIRLDFIFLLCTITDIFLVLIKMVDCHDLVEENH